MNIFETREIHQINIAFWELCHFDTRVIQWKCVEASLCGPSDSVAWLPQQIIHSDMDGVFVRFDIKVFKEDEADSEDVPWQEYVPRPWAYTNGC